MFWKNTAPDTASSSLYTMMKWFRAKLTFMEKEVVPVL